MWFISRMVINVTQELKANAFTKRCPWCERWPKVQTHDQGKYWAICVNPKCPVNPVTNATNTPEAAADLWNLCRR